MHQMSPTQKEDWSRNLIKKKNGRVSQGFHYIWTLSAQSPLWSQLLVHSLSSRVSCKGSIPKNAPRAPTTLISSPLIVSNATSTIFFDILSPHTKAAYVSLDLGMASYIYTRAEGLRPQLSIKARLCCHMAAMRLLHIHETCTRICSLADGSKMTRRNFPKYTIIVWVP